MTRKQLGDLEKGKLPAQAQQLPKRGRQMIWSVRLQVRIKFRILSTSHNDDELTTNWRRLTKLHLAMNGEWVGRGNRSFGLRDRFPNYNRARWWAVDEVDRSWSIVRHWRDEKSIAGITHTLLGLKLAEHRQRQTQHWLCSQETENSASVQESVLETANI